MIRERDFIDLNKRASDIIDEIQEDEKTEIITFVEIRITSEQLGVMSAPMFGFNKAELTEYYKEKIHTNLLLTKSIFGSTTIEDQPDFQFIFDLGVKALGLGIKP